VIGGEEKLQGLGRRGAEAAKNWWRALVISGGTGGYERAALSQDTALPVLLR
jgi:hypothetical protein